MNAPDLSQLFFCTTCDGLFPRPSSRGKPPCLCFSCKREKERLRAQEDRRLRPEAQRERSRRYRERHPERVKASNYEKVKAWRAANKDKLREQARRKYLRHPERFAAWGRAQNLRKFGLTDEQYSEMLYNQNGRCAICCNLPDEKKRLAVDHCHVTGKVRGLLCSSCNTALGRLGDSVEGLKKALKYLEVSNGA